MSGKLAVRLASEGEHAFVVTRAMGEFRRAHLHDVIVRDGGPGFIRWVLARPDGRAAVVEAEGVLVGAALGVASAVLALALPVPLRDHAVRDDLLRIVGAGDALPFVTWLVPAPRWTQKALCPVLDPFRLHQRPETRT